MRKKEIIELSVTGVLLVVMIFALTNAAAKSRARNAKKALSAIESPVVMPVAALDQKIDSKDLYNLLEKQAQLIEVKRDPFSAAPIIIEKDAQTGVVLTGILWDKDKPMAIIEGQIVKLGQRVGNQTVMEIKRDRVILSDGEVFSEVRLQK